MTDRGAERFCIALFKRAKTEYFAYMDSDNKTKISELKDKFTSGELDVYAGIFSSSAEDIWARIEKEYATNMAY